MIWNSDLYLKEDLISLLQSFEKCGDFFEYFGISDNSYNYKKFHELCKTIGFDPSFYKKKKERFCINCGKKLSRGQKKFCSSSCSATYNNHLRVLKDRKIKEKKQKSPKRPLEKDVKIIEKKYSFIECKNCGKVFYGNKDRKFCCNSCNAEDRHNEAYKDFLENPEKYQNGGYTPKAFKKEFLKEQNGICAICGAEQMHNNKPLVFVLDHIDGDASNNRRENLRMICPNCDSQLDTFKSKNKNSKRRNYWKEKILRSSI